MDDKDLKAISSKLDVIIRLLSHQMIQGKNQTESILFLGQLGLDRNVIAEMVGSSPATVSVRLSEAKNRANKKLLKGEINE